MNAQMEKYVAPVQELNSLAVSNIEKITNLQVKRFEESAKVGLEQLKAATAVKDADTLKEFLTGYTEAVRQLSESTVADARTLLELGNSYTTEAQRILKDSLNTN